MASDNNIASVIVVNSNSIMQGRDHVNARSCFDESELDDESNLINKEDFEEGKQKDIVTARATPIKCNALAKKNLTTARKQSMNSPPTLSSISQFQDPNNPHSSGVYYQIVNNQQTVLSQTFKMHTEMKPYNNN
jgi:hypothetical protein